MVESLVAYVGLVMDLPSQDFEPSFCWERKYWFFLYANLFAIAMFWVCSVHVSIELVQWKTRRKMGNARVQVMKLMVCKIIVRILMLYYWFSLFLVVSYPASEALIVIS